MKFKKGKWYKFYNNGHPARLFLNNHYYQCLHENDRQTGQFMDIYGLPDGFAPYNYEYFDVNTERD